MFNLLQYPTGMRLQKDEKRGKAREMKKWEII